MRRAALVLALLACGCAIPGEERILCAAAPKEALERALGAPLATAKPLPGVDMATCVWTAGDPAGTPPRTLTASVWREDSWRNRKTRDSSTLHFEDALHELELQSLKTRPLGGLGDAAVIGFGQIGDERFTGGLVVRKGKKVLVMHVSGEDPGAFEETARAVAQRL